MCQALDFLDLEVADSMRSFIEAVPLSESDDIGTSLVARFVPHRYSRYPYLDGEFHAVVKKMNGPPIVCLRIIPKVEPPL